MGEQPAGGTQGELRGAPVSGSGRRRKRWEGRWQQRTATEFCWYLDAPPTELTRLVEEDGLPAGAALDLGCGSGVATAYLARFFSPALGLDIALGAVSQARDFARERGTRPSFVVAEVPILPLRSEAFSLIFDRGCLQGVPKEAWPVYFREADRLLKAGGVLQLFASKPMKRFPPLLSYRGIRARGRWLLGKRGARFLTHSYLESLLPPSMLVVTLEDHLYQPKAGPARLMTHGTFRKRTA